jgi:chemotaxis protein methyltransferase CheR
MDRDVIGAFKGADVILCRNVLIYFSEDAIRSVAETFYETLSDDGYLFLGHSESLARITDIYHTRRYPSAIVYCKKGE